VTERRQVAREVEPELVERYVENGALRIEWRDFAYLRQESVKDTQATRADQEQGRFSEYHDALYEIQGSANGGTLSDEKLADLVRELDLLRELRVRATLGQGRDDSAEGPAASSRSGDSGHPELYHQRAEAHGTEPPGRLQSGY
jgi:hypothetical protein